MKWKNSFIAGCCMVLIYTMAGVQYCTAQMSASYFQLIQLPGAATHISVGANGALWRLGTANVPGGHDIWFWGNNTWMRVDGSAEKIAVGPNGQPWIINASGNIYKREADHWEPVCGFGKDIAVGANGSVWVLGGQQVGKLWQIFNYGGMGWTQVDGAAHRVCVAPDGSPWVIGENGQLYRRDGNIWTLMATNARTVSVNAQGDIYIAGIDNMTRLQSTLLLVNGQWLPLQGVPAVKELAAAPDGMLYALGEQDQIYQMIPNKHAGNHGNNMGSPMGTQPGYTPAATSIAGVQITQTDHDREEREREEHERIERERREHELPVRQIGCRNALRMGEGDMQSAVSTINKQSFDDSKLTTAKQVAGANCLSTDQIGQIMALFSFEDRKLTFAEFAYDHCTDPQSYYKLNSQFSFSTNSDALSNFVQGKQ